MKKVRQILFVILISLTTLAIYLIPTFIPVGKIDCKTQFGECSGEISQKIASFQGKSLREVKRGIKKYFSGSLLISDYSFQYKFPDILLINILLTKPLFAIKSSDLYAYVDKEGRIISFEKETNLPFVEIVSKMGNLGDQVPEDHFFALKLLRGVFNLYQVKTGRLGEGSLIVDLPSQIRVIFPLEGDPEVLLGSLRIIHEKITSEGFEEGTDVKEIDLRYKNPVLR